MAAHEHVGNAAETTLSGDITSGATSFSVAAGTGYPTGASGKKFVISIGEGGTFEKVLCTARSGNNFTVDPAGRGYDNTSAVAHTVGEKIRHVLAAAKVQEIDDFVARGALLTVGAGSYGGLTIPSATMRRILCVPASGAVAEKFYTVPAGKKALILASYATNSGASVVFESFLVASGGTPGDTTNRWLRYSFASAGSPTGWGASALLSAGDELWWRASAVGTIGIYTNLIEFDAAIPVTGGRGSVNIADGDKTVYTCPSGKVAVPFVWGEPFSTATYGGILFNPAGLTSTVTMKIKRAGGSALQFGPSYSVASLASQFAVPRAIQNPPSVFLEAGDLITVATTQDGLLFWVPMIEFTA